MYPIRRIACGPHHSSVVKGRKRVPLLYSIRHNYDLRKATVSNEGIAYVNSTLCKYCMFSTWTWSSCVLMRYSCSHVRPSSISH